MFITISKQDGRHHKLAGTLARIISFWYYRWAMFLFTSLWKYCWHCFETIERAETNRSSKACASRDAIAATSASKSSVILKRHSEFILDRATANRENRLFF